jgi:uncharacterized Zn-finger protein
MQSDQTTLTVTSILLKVSLFDTNTSPASQQSQSQNRSHPQTQTHIQSDSQTSYPQYSTQSAENDRKHRHQHGLSDFAGSQRTAIPPTPPLRNDSVVEGTHSPSTVSSGSSLSTQPYYVGSALNNVEAVDQRVATSCLVKRHSIPSQPNTSPYGNSSYNVSPYTSSPGAISTNSYYPPADPNYPVAGLYNQRPLPSNFPPPSPGTVQSTPTIPAANPWEHHHYISASSQATYPQPQDRYICQTCNKAFSRPSSLKIHSHSHTGEKPFKCPHSGCGKAFSVRSNMKRHERGCHNGNTGVLSSSHLA